MGLDLIVNQIEREAKQRALTILEEAKKQENSIILEAKKQGKNMVLQAQEQAKEFSKNYYIEKISAAKNESERILQETREEAIENALKALWKEFVNFSKSPSYPKFLKKLAVMAIEELQLPSVVFVVNQRDAKIISNLGLKVANTSAIAGGLIGQSKDGKVIADYSFETIFEQKKSTLRAQIRQFLLEQEGGLQKPKSAHSKKQANRTRK